MNLKDTILLVDDEPEVLKVFKMWLEKQGYHVYTSANKNGALKIVKEHPIAVCLVDMNLQEETGLQIARELKRVDELLKIIIITGYPNYESALKAMRLGVFDYTSKSAGFTMIHEKVESALKSRTQEIAEKCAASENRFKIIVACHHMMIREELDNFCFENPQYRILHHYHSLDYLRNNEFNKKAEVVLVCSVCNQAHLVRLYKTIHRLQNLFSAARIVTINCDSSNEDKIRLLKLGIQGFLPANISKDDMKRAFDAIRDGQIWADRKLISSLLKELLLQTVQPVSGKNANPYKLSSRQIEMLQAAAAGLSNRDISTKFEISERTVKIHLNQVFKRMGVKSRTQAIQKALEAHIF